MTDLDKFFVHQLNAPQTRRLEQLDLGFYQKIKGHLWDKQARPWPCRVTDSSSDILIIEV
jgi:hypothetical protein